MTATAGNKEPDWDRLVADAVIQYETEQIAPCPTCGHPKRSHQLHTCFDCEYGEGCARR